MFFLRKSSLEQLPLVMSGVRMGERALQIGVGDQALAGAIAAKVGLSGHAAMAVSDERQGTKARAAATAAGALVDVQVTALDSLPFADDSFDLVVLHAAAVTVGLADAAAVAILRDSRRVLRSGGRIVTIEHGARPGLMGRLRRPPRPDEGAAIAALASAGFAVARLLAEREGYRFLEGIK